MKRRIIEAFSQRQRPHSVIDQQIDGDTLRDDALHFDGKDWTTVTASDWLNYSDATHGLSPQAFIYFLPSLLITSLESSDGLVAADSIIYALDTSADPDLWSEWFNERFLLLTPPELAVLKEWGAAYLANEDKGHGSTFVRVQDTLDMLSLLAEC
jgi:hypothetical protein